MEHSDLVRLRRASRSHAANVISAITEPPIILVAVLLLVCQRHTGDVLSGLAWAAFTALMIVVIPYCVVLVVAKCVHGSDRHLVRRDHRVVPFGAAVASAVVGTVVLWRLDLPVAVHALVLAMLAGLVTMVIVNFLLTKASFHTAVVAGASGVMVIELGAQALVPAVVVNLVVAWARWRAGRHSVVQVLTGLGVGALPATLVYAPLTSSLLGW